jgi:hypothetical protein
VIVATGLKAVRSGAVSPSEDHGEAGVGAVGHGLLLRARGEEDVLAMTLPAPLDPALRLALAEFFARALNALPAVIATGAVRSGAVSPSEDHGEAGVGAVGHGLLLRARYGPERPLATVTDIREGHAIRAHPAQLRGHRS